jgi:hypothetical protein
MMTSTGTRTATFTITEARYVGAKIGTDLRLLNSLYGAPSLARIDKFTEEAALLLRDGYLGTVSYGFRDGTTNEWKLRLRYTATTGGYLTDSRAGSLPATASVDGYNFYSYLTYSSKFLALSGAEKAKIEGTLPLARGTADQPAARSGTVGTANSYSRNGVGVARDVFTAA